MTVLHEISMEEKLAFLSQPVVYPHNTKQVLVKETHMSWVFLIDDFVYKMKKPVAFDLFDFRGLSSRYENCKEEHRINQLLAKDTYLGVVPLVINENEKLQLEGKGEAVEWFVKMKRIPEENMLDYAIQHHCLNEAKVREAAILLARYYNSARPISFTGKQFLLKMEDDIDENYLHLSSALYALSPGSLKTIHDGLITFLHAYEYLFKERTFRRKILDAHGDLRPEHICLTPVPVIIDRLEFSKALRMMDPAEELSYLSMECELLGNHSVGELFFAEYANCTNDFLHADLIKFYKAKKAFVRAYLVVRHMDEEQYKNDPKWPAKAKLYLTLAENYLNQLTP